MQAVAEVNWEAELAKWKSDVGNLLKDIRDWSKTRNWGVLQSSTIISEDHFGQYELPKLELGLPSREKVIVEPRYRLVFGAMGRVDIYAYPSLDRYVLLRKQNPDRWILRGELGPTLPIDWNEENFEKIINSLVS